MVRTSLRKFPPIRRFLNIYLILLIFVSSPLAPAIAQDKGPVVARVNQHEIHLSDVYASIESHPLGQQINMRRRFDLVIRSLVQEELLFQWILSSDSKWEKQQRDVIKALMVERVIKKYVTERIKVSDEDIREYYRENRDSLRGWHVRVRQILLNSRSECEDMMQRINSEKSFTELAKAHSLDRNSAGNGGDLGYLMYSKNIPQSLGFEQRFFEMKLGEMRIFESEQGCHLVRVIEIDDPPDPPFERIREFLKPRLERAQERVFLNELIEKVSRNARVEIVGPASK